VSKRVDVIQEGGVIHQIRVIQAVRVIEEVCLTQDAVGLVDPGRGSRRI
jgi:hypothetical protein